MATISAVERRKEDGSRMVSWANMGQTAGVPDTGSAAYLGADSDKTAHAVGTFGAGPGAVHILGSNDGGTTWTRLRDQAGVLIALTAAAPMSIILEHPELIRADVGIGENGVTNVSVHINVAIKRG